MYRYAHTHVPSSSHSLMVLSLCSLQVSLHMRLLPYDTLDKNLIQFVGMAVSTLLTFCGIIINHTIAKIRVAEFAGEDYKVPGLKANLEFTKNFLAIVSIGGIILTVVIQVGKYALDAYVKRGGVTSELLKKLTCKKKGKQGRIRRSSLGSAISVLADTESHTSAAAATVPQPDGDDSIGDGIEMSTANPMYSNVAGNNAQTITVRDDEHTDSTTL